MIHIVGRDSLPFMAAFDDVSKALEFDCDVYLGAFASMQITGQVVYNMEYLHDDAPLVRAGYVDTLRRNTVIDYNRQNVQWLAARGIEAFYMPYGYHICLERPVDVGHDIDVLFIGTTHHPRRLKVLKSLSSKCNLVVASGVYGSELDVLRARSKVHLNMHHAEGQPLEVVRLNYLMANHCTVVSEQGCDGGVNKAYEDGLIFADYSDLVDACLSVSPMDGYEVIKSMPQRCGSANKWIKEKLCLQ